MWKYGRLNETTYNVKQGQNLLEHGLHLLP